MERELVERRQGLMFWDGHLELFRLLPGGIQSVRGDFFISSVYLAHVGRSVFFEPVRLEVLFCW